MDLTQSLLSLKEPALPRSLARLPDVTCRSIMVLSSLVGANRKLPGQLCHEQMGDLLRAELDGDRQLQEWLEGRSAGCRVTGKSFDVARKRADLWIRKGRWAACWSGGMFPQGNPSPRCPEVLFGQGSIEPDQFWVGFFNSRKPKIISPDAQWMQVLRALVPLLSAQNLGFASSLGTATYDLVTVGATQMGSRLLLVLPTALERLCEPECAQVVEANSSPALVLTCSTEAMSCPKPMRMACRDRILAGISDLHCILELRAGGNLMKIIAEQQTMQPRLQWIYRPDDLNRGNAGNLKILGDFPGSAKHFSRTDTGIPAVSGRKGEASRRAVQVIHLEEVRWEEYLYHYTRSCAGPWPGETHRDYLLSLLRNEPLSDHTALTALIRMLWEGLIRASSLIVRGDHPVVSWTSRPPADLSAIRRWNPALIRWTFEPYGIAVKRKVLKKHGAVPAIYAASSTYEQLQPKDRFRFQLHELPRCSWKEEREWRLPGSFDLTQLNPGDAFGFAPVDSDLEALAKQVPFCKMPMVVLGGKD